MRKPSSNICSAEPSGTSRTDLSKIAQLLAQLRSPDAQAGWEQFLLQYSEVLYQVLHAFTHDDDEAADCFVYSCEQLAKNGFRRLTRFKLDGTASFATWLRVVTRNLCYDWHRKKHGRFRPFESVKKLSALELEVYRCRFERSLSLEETFLQLRTTWPTVNVDELADIESRIENSLNSRQRWLLSAWKQRGSNTTVSDSKEETEEDARGAVDAGPSPETIAILHQERARLQECLDLLPPIERLVVQLRFVDELSLEEVAHLTGLQDAQTVHRKLAAILHKLKTNISPRTERKIGDRVREIRQETK